MEQNTPKERLNALILEKSIPNYLSTSQLIKDALGEFDQTEEYVNKAQKLVDDAIPAAMEAREADYMEACKLMETADVNFISDENPLLLPPFFCLFFLFSSLFFRLFRFFCIFLHFFQNFVLK